MIWLVKNSEEQMELKQHIQEDILNGKLSPGSKINISHLRCHYNVGLAPLREALSKLTSTGLLLSEQNKGYSVAPVSEEELIDLYTISAHIETLAIAQAIERGNEKWEEEIISSLYHLSKLELSKKNPSFELWRAANARFHTALIASCSNVIHELRRTLGLKSERYVRLAFNKVKVKDFNQEHKALADAALSRDQETAKKLIHEHCMNGLGIHIKRFRNVQK